METLPSPCNVVRTPLPVVSTMQPPLTHLFVIFLHGGQILASLAELAFLHALTDIPMDECYTKRTVILFVYMVSYHIPYENCIVTTVGLWTCSCISFVWAAHQRILKRSSTSNANPHEPRRTCCPTYPHRHTTGRMLHKMHNDVPCVPGHYIRELRPYWDHGHVHV